MKLLNHYGIKKRLVSSHTKNERSTAKKVVSELTSGKSAAVVSDNGTPGISDPGGILVEQCRNAGIKVVPVPGPSVVTTILSVCGWNTSPFVFLGFLSNKSGRRKKAIGKYKNFEGVIVIYESPHRVYKTLLDLYEVLGNKEIVIGREISKKYENILSTNLLNIADNNIELIEKGEFVLAVNN
jgi:16S rRNA (cytidine1402-2'-O)-methyltransferase